MKTQYFLELDYIGSPADYLFYKGELLPLYTPLRIQMQQKLEKLVCSEWFRKKILEADVRTESETDSSDITHCKVGCKENETYNNDCQPENESV